MTKVIEQHQTPAIPAVERYKQAFEVWRFASEVRFKILAAWWAVYIGLGAVFSWMWEHPPFRQVAFVVPLIALLATGLFYTMDQRNGGAIFGSKGVIQALDAGDDIPAKQKIIERSNYGILKHSTAILLFAITMAVTLLGLTVYAYCRRFT
jgi:hypothetical protein